MTFTTRQLTEADWELYRDIRLTALQSDPSSFGSTYVHEFEFTPEKWQYPLQDQNSAIFGLFEDNQIIGMTGIFIPKTDSTQTTAKLFGSWISKNYRNQGLSSHLYQPRIEWAKSHPTINKIIYTHYDYNKASESAGKKHGFTITHTEKTNDGKIEVWYELWVKPKPLER